MAKNLAAQIEHHLLAGPLHEICLQELEQKTEDQQSYIDGRDLRDPGDGARAQPTPYAGDIALSRRQVAINCHLGEIGTEHVGERLQDDRNQRNRHLPAVGTQIVQQPRASGGCHTLCLILLLPEPSVSSSDLVAEARSAANSVPQYRWPMLSRGWKRFAADEWSADGIMVWHAPRHLYFGAVLPHQVQLLQLRFRCVFAGVFERYVDRVCADIGNAPQIARQMGGQIERVVDSIYLGGGTPTVLESAQLERIFAAVRSQFVRAARRRNHRRVRPWAR